jgi:hypothetical protein
MRIYFDEVKLWTKKRGKCDVCGKQGNRSVKVCHTVNPYNRKADGVPKTRGEVYDDVKKEFDRRMALAFVHAKCEGKKRTATNLSQPKE